MSLDTRDVEDLDRLLRKLLGELLARTGERQDRGPQWAGNDWEQLARRAELLLEDRRRRKAIFGPHMFAEPAWEMLLLLYLGASGQRHTQSRLAELSGASRSTGLRWIEFLERQGLIRREAHPTDKRRTFVGLSARGRELLELYLSETD